NPLFAVRRFEDCWQILLQGEPRDTRRSHRLLSLLQRLLSRRRGRRTLFAFQSVLPCAESSRVGLALARINAGRAINDPMPLDVLNLIADTLNEEGREAKGSKIAVLGLTYKENVGDYRESPSVVLIEELKKKGADVHLVDPYIEECVLREFATPEETAYQALSGADALVLMTAHSEFKGLDLPKIKEMVRTPIIVDGRRVFDPDAMRQSGFVYKGVGANNE